MKKLFILCVLLVSSFLLYAVETKPVIAVYPAWKHDSNSIQALPWQRFSHLALTGVYPQDDSGLLTDSVDHFIKELVAAAHKNGKRVILSVGGSGRGSKGFIKITQSDKTLNTFVKNLSAYATQHQFDGIYIDWEYWTYQSELNKGGQDPVESARLVNLMKALRSQFPEPFVLSVDIAPGDWVGSQYQLALQDHVTYVNLMAFDFTGAWASSKIGYHSDLKTFGKSLDYVVNRGFNPSKIIVGLPAYGIEFVDGKNREIKHQDYKEIAEVALTKANKSNQLKHVYYEDQESIQKKCASVNKRKMAGVFIFTVLSDHNADELSLLAACNREIYPQTLSSAQLQP